MNDVCQVCAARGEAGGDPPGPAEYIVRVTAPAEAARENPLLRLCHTHAQQAAEAFVGFEWSIYVGKRKI